MLEMPASALATAERLEQEKLEMRQVGVVRIDEQAIGQQSFVADLDLGDVPRAGAGGVSRMPADDRVGVIVEDEAPARGHERDPEMGVLALAEAVEKPDFIDGGAAKES